MTTRGLAIFDGDDTLWASEELYDAALEEASRIVDRAGLPPDEWRTLQRKFDLQNVVKMGMSRERFPKSSTEALLHLAAQHEQPVAPGLVAEVVEASESVFNARASLLPNVEETLRALDESSFALALMTKGDPEVQRRRVEQSGLEGWFDLVRIVPQKTETEFVRVVEHFGLRTDQAWSIGNSLPSDINPALSAGLHAIWIDAYVWEHEQQDHHPAHDRLTVLHRLEDVPAVLIHGQFAR
jgi:putative hydrolase of the HAD superfamily